MQLHEKTNDFCAGLWCQWYLLFAIDKINITCNLDSPFYTCQNKKRLVAERSFCSIQHVKEGS
jgi:hypothetical protein